MRTGIVLGNDEVVALHEVGHCLMHLYVGWPFKSVELTEFTDRHGAKAFGRVTTRLTPDQLGKPEYHLQKALLINLGGLAAESCYYNKPPEQLLAEKTTGAGDDIYEVEELLKLSTLSESEKNRLHVKCFQEAYAVVSTQWHKVNIAADRLVEKRFLTFEDVKHIIY